MALSVPIISEFDGRGIKKAIAEFKQLEGVGAKAQFALKKAAVPATAALGALAAASAMSVKAAMEDQKSQRELARTLEISAGATEEQVKQIERMIGAYQMAAGVADTELRAAYASLVRGTKDLTQAEQGLTIAMDISAATGQSLTAVADALSKAYAGNMRGLRALSPEMAMMIKEGATLEEVLAVLGGTFGGAFAAQAETAEGQMKRFRIALDEAQEAIGYALLPALEAVLPYLQQFGDWAQNNTGTITKVAAAVGALAAAIVAANVAATVAAHPLIFLASLATALTLAFARVNNQLRQMEGILPRIGNQIVNLLGGPVVRLLDALGSIGGRFNFRMPDFNLPGIPGLAEGGIVTRPTLAMIGEGGGPEAVIPLDRMGGMGTTINIYSTLADETLPEKLVQALRTYNRTTGPVRIQVI